MKNILLTITLFAGTLLSTSCNDWVDVNTNPNYISELSSEEVNSLIPTIQLRTAQKVGYDISLYGYFWSQYVNQCSSTNQYYTIMTYNVTNSSFTSPWTYFYAYNFPALKEIMDKTQDLEGYENYYFCAKIMLCYNLYLMTSLYGDVAYTDGFVNGSLTPEFDSEQDMQKILINLLEEVRAMDVETVQTADANHSLEVSKSDMMTFVGDNASGDWTTNWLQFANTLYLKMLMRDFNANKSKIENVLANSELLTSDFEFNNYEDMSDKSSPLYESDRRQLNTTQNIRSCADIVGVSGGCTGVLDMSDPRLTYYYDNITTSLANPYGSQYGVSTSRTKSARLRLTATDPVYFGTADEADFLKAECYARLGGHEAEAKAAYEKALEEVFTRTGCTLTDALKTKYAFKGTTAEEQVECIINQKWASNVRCMPIESWFDINRTGYPERGKTITSTHGVLESGYPYRFLISKTSSDNNPNSPEIKAVNEKMWWHK